MDYKISFKEMTKLAEEKLSKQLLSTLEEKREQFKNLKKKL